MYYVLYIYQHHKPPKPPKPPKNQDKNGATPLDLAVKKGQRRVAAFLRARAAVADAGFAWRQLLSVRHWRAWLQGGGNAEVGAVWGDWV